MDLKDAKRWLSKVYWDICVREIDEFIKSRATTNILRQPPRFRRPW